jgi:ribosome maturation factor RimP
VPTIPELVEETVVAAGCELVRVRELPKRTVEAMVDRPPKGPNVDDLIALTRALNAAFEAAGLDPGEFNIEVISPGIDRPLIRDADFERFAGEQVHVKTKEKREIDGRRNYKGPLVGLDDDGRIVVRNPDEPEEPWRFTRDEVREVRLVPQLPKIKDPHPNAQGGGRGRKPRKSRRKRPRDH